MRLGRRCSTVGCCFCDRCCLYAALMFFSLAAGCGVSSGNATLGAVSVAGKMRNWRVSLGCFFVFNSKICRLVALYFSVISSNCSCNILRSRSNIFKRVSRRSSASTGYSGSFFLRFDLVVVLVFCPPIFWSVLEVNDVLTDLVRS